VTLVSARSTEPYRTIEELRIMRTVIFNYRALVSDDIDREQLDAMNLAAFVQIQDPETGSAPETVKAELWQTVDTPAPGVEVEDLGGWFDQFQPAMHAALFGAMVRRSRLVVERYHGDLFHDARWIGEHAQGETSFYWAPRTFGANIGTDPTLVGYGYGSRDDEMHFYRIDVHERVRNGKKTGMWQATFTRCNPATCEDLTPKEAV
jgi:hypothetical protein